MKQNLFKQGMFQIDPGTTPDQIKRKRELLAGIVKGGYGNARYAGQGAMHALTGLAEGFGEHRMSKFEQEKTAETEGLLGDMVTGPGGAYDSDTQRDLMLALSNPWLTPSQKQAITMQLGMAQSAQAKAEAAAKAQAARAAGAAQSGAASDFYSSIFSGGGAAGQTGTPFNPPNSPRAQAPAGSGSSGFSPLMGNAPISAPLDMNNPSAPREFTLSTQGAQSGADSMVGGMGNDTLLGAGGDDALEGVASPLATSLPAAPAPSTFRLGDSMTGRQEGYAPAAGITPQAPQAAPQPRVDPVLGPELPEQLRYKGPPAAQLRQFLDMGGGTRQQRAHAAAMLKEAEEWENPRSRAMMRMEFNRNAGLIGQDPETQFVKGVGLIDMNTGDVIADYGGGGPGDPTTEYGLTPQFGVDKDGNPVMIQVGKNGEAVQTALPEGVELRRKPIEVDAGTHTILLDPITRNPIGQIPKNVGVAAQEKAEGAASGKINAEKAASAPIALDQAQTALRYISELRESPNRERGTGASSFFNFVPGTKGRDFQARIDRLAGGAFLTAIDQLRGLGALSNAEGQAATASVAALDPGQSEEAFMKALDDYERIINLGIQRAQGGASPAAAPQPEKSAARMTREEFYNSPRVKAVADKHGLTLDEYWEVFQ